jgi:hypothetical protein
MLIKAMIVVGHRGNGYIGDALPTVMKTIRFFNEKKG